MSGDDEFEGDNADWGIEELDPTSTSEIIEALRAETPEKQAIRRASAVNRARHIGLTWKSIAEHLEMTPAGVQRAPGVDSPWNSKKEEA